MSEETKVLTVDRVQYLIDELKSALPKLDGLDEALRQTRDEVQSKLAQLAFNVNLKGKIDQEALDAFGRRPFTLEPVRGREEGWYHLIVPRFIDMQVGWLDSQDESFNKFLVNRYVDYLGEIPELIKKELGWKPPPELELMDGVITGKPNDLDNFLKKHRTIISSRVGNKLIPKKNKHFELLAALIKEGVLPFKRQSVSEELRIDRKCDIDLREYQKEAWKRFLEYSNVGIFYPASVGKSFFGVWVLTKIKGPNLVAVPTVMVKEMWEQRIELHTDLKLNEDVFVCTYQSAISKFSKTKHEFGVKIVDEVHHIPANEFSRLSTIPSQTSIGLTASPQREDHREEFIFALTGQPIGLSWQYFRELNLIREPICHVWLVKGFEQKIHLIEHLITNKKSLIFCDSIELGKMVSSRFSIPHVYGATKKDRLATIKESDATVVSRVGDEGVSLPDVEQVIEISWLGKSRRQELQRFTRLLHSMERMEPAYHIMMTADEYTRDRQRLFSVMDKGFKVEIHREGVSERALQTTEKPRATRAKQLGPRAMVEPSAPEKTPTLPEALVQRLPGIVKSFNRLSTQEKTIAGAILANPSIQYDMKQLSLVTGYSVGYLTGPTYRSFKVLTDAGLIKKVGKGKYQSAV